MVKLRSGTVYIDKTAYNLRANQFNTFIYDLYTKVIYSSLPISEMNDDMVEITNISSIVKVHKGSKGAHYYIKNYRRYYLNNLRNAYRRRALYEKLWILMIEFMNKYINKNKKFQKINLGHNEAKCLICYNEVNKTNLLNICIDKNDKCTVR